MKVTMRPEPELQVYVAWGGQPDWPAASSRPTRGCPDFAWRMLTPRPCGDRDAGGLGPVSAGRRAAGRVARHGSRSQRVAGSRVRRTGRRVLVEGLLYGAGTDGADQVPRAGQAAAGSGGGQRPVAGAGHAGIARRRRRRTMRSGLDGIGLASVRLDAIGGALHCGEATLVPAVPDWMRLPEKAG